jgi:Cytochrome c554 and c-prime
MSKRLALFLCFASGAVAQYVGAEVCGGCHAGRLKQQSASGHTRALRPALEHPLADRFVKNGRAVPGSHPRYEFARTPAGFVVHLDRETIPVPWAFGAGRQAVTFVAQLDKDRYVELRYSFYARAGGLDITPGHPARSKTAYPDSAGVVHPTFDPDAAIMRCFQCHSTGGLSLGSRFEIVPAELGVRCEACHGPGKAHVDAIRAGKVAAARKAIDNPGRLSAAAQIQFCGDCHRKPQQGETATDWTDAWNTRHQPLYLAQAACFQKSGGRLTCTTCHDPHAALTTDAAFYNHKCTSCHSAPPHSAPADARNHGNCVGCHMPAVSPRAHMEFANHWIGVYREGSPLKPIRRP